MAQASDTSDWITHDGGPMPVPGDALVLTRRPGATEDTRPELASWWDGDGSPEESNWLKSAGNARILEYRVVQQTPRTPITGEEVADVLERAADLIAKPGAWTQGYYGLTDSGAYADTPRDAVCFCALGAIKAAQHAVEFDAEIDDAERFFRNFNGSITSWNDAPERTQAEVVAALRQAATAARQQGEGR